MSMLKTLTVEGNDVYVWDDQQVPKPVVFVIHGGAWHTGSKESNRPVCTALAEQGYVAVSTSYGLSSVSNEHIGTALTVMTIFLLTLALTCPTVDQMMLMLLLSLFILTFFSILWLFWPREEVQHPAHILDVARNFKWVTEHIAEFGGDPQKIAVMGHSAGGHLASLLATNTSYLHQVGVDPSFVKACVSISGVYSDQRLKETQLGSQLLRTVFGQRPQYYDAFPLYHASKETCPFLLLNAGLDLTLKRHTFDFHYALRQAGVYVKTVYFDSETHWTIMRDWTQRNRGVMEALHDFLEERWEQLESAAA